MASILDQFRQFGIADVIVTLKPSARPAAAAGPASGIWRQLSRHFSLKETTTTSQIFEEAVRLGFIARGKGRPRVKPKIPFSSEPVQPVQFYPHLGLAFGSLDQDGYHAVKGHKDVAQVVAAPTLRLVRPVEVLAAKLTRSVPWGIERLKIPKLWSKGLSGKGILLGHLDTGLDGGHPAFKGAIASFALFDSLGRLVTRKLKPFDSDDSGHGTHTAATIAGRPVKGRHLGCAPGAKLASAVVIEGGRVLARILGGMDWAIGQGVRILSMSLGVPGYEPAFEIVVEALRANGVLPVIAVGNDGPGAARSPGDYSHVLSVGAIDSGDRVASFSSSRRFARQDDPLVPDLIAPGVKVVSAVPSRAYASMSGTSMATPHVAGLAALLMEARPQATALQVETAILDSCALPPGVPPERGNRGVPDAVKALQLIESR